MSDVRQLKWNACLIQVFTDNFVHGDLHPGNIIVQNTEYFDAEEESKLVLVDICDTVVVNVRPPECPIRLVLLDCGITSYLSSKDLVNLRSVFTAVVLGEVKSYYAELDFFELENYDTIYILAYLSGMWFFL